MKKNLFVFAFLSLMSWANAQEYPVSYGLIQTCGAFLVDNGYSANDYGPNENSTSTICPDGTGDPIVNLHFASFSLGTGDQLSIYDGNSTAAPLIGTYQGTSLLSMDVYATNGSGCLTVVFSSNSDASVGNFGAEISCGLPCARPFAIITNDQLDQNPTKLCVGEEIIFSGASSTFQNGAQLSGFTWDFNDGTPDNTINWPNVTHSFSEPGAYLVQLALTDDNDCSSANLPDMLIYVSTEPDFDISATDYQVCIGQEVNLAGNVTPVTWSSVPQANFGGALFIPDEQDQCFSSDLLFGGFEPGSTIQNVNDLDHLFINFEHSFMGDLIISLICPNGQSVVVHELGGGGTLLGEPVDVDELPNVEGIGYDYFWAPDATNGTWEDNGWGGTLPSGTYESVYPWTSLVGCPLNGAWTIEVCDTWASDNGFIFDWTVKFADDLYPELITFTPSIGTDCNSTYWSGQFITSTSANCNNLVINPSEEGSFTYTYTVLDNHGCTYTEDLIIQAYPGPIPSAGEDAPYCNDLMILNGEITNPVSGINYSYMWSPSQPLNNANLSDPTINNLQESTTFTLSVFPQNDPQCIVSDTVEIFIPDVPPSSPADSLELCLGSTVPLVPVVDDEMYNYIWTFSAVEDGISEVIQENGSILAASEAGYYWVEIIEPVCNFSSVSPYYVTTIECEIIIPNVFTPNGDDYNDTFFIKGLENFPQSSLVVFNRWGAKIYDNDNYKNDWSPRDLSEGVYYFILGLKSSDGSFKYYEQHLTLLRD